ncbi:hypothetical protein TRFO_02294 [Tritrichomonas foetus]|uniref:Importin N-terminal domain-containing protein n=1 Tax=Tritrichomonas foetus TaxID=1144522 RepID=A0A1J4J819_9EUKA|nr:hypothetical protein TRFO_02294 [Tritrichomonas foetus]|eukprot:OHS95280.1 hypothetical protein TRFO_02294 [Tritrichomonas foetus]
MNGEINEIENIINQMLSQGEFRQQAEEIYTNILNNQPFQLVQYHFQSIYSDLTNSANIRKNLTLLHNIFRKGECFRVYTPENNQFIQANIIRCLSMIEFDQYNRALLVDIADKLQTMYNIDLAPTDSKNLEWPDIITFCMQLSTSPDENLSASGIELISRFVYSGTLQIEPNFPFLFQIIQNVLSMEEYSSRLLSVASLIKEIFIIEFEDDETEEFQITKFASLFLTKFHLVPFEKSDAFFDIITLIDYHYFFSVLEESVACFLSIISNNSSPQSVKVRLLLYLNKFVKRKPEQMKKMAEQMFYALNFTFASVCENEDMEIPYSFSYAGNLLYVMSDCFDSQLFDEFCINAAKELLSKEDWNLRFAGISIFSSIHSIIKKKLLLECCESFFDHIQDPSSLCRFQTYKAFRGVASHKRSQFNGYLHNFIFPKILITIPQETNLRITVCAFKTLACFCYNSGSEILSIYGSSILQLCVAFSKRCEVDIQTSILNCMQSMAKSMQRHLEPSFDLISQFIFQMGQIEVIKIRYHTIVSIPDICLIASPELYNELAKFGVNLYLQTNQEMFTDIEQVNLLQAFLKLLKMIDYSSLIPVIRQSIMNLLRISSQNLDVSVNATLDPSIYEYKYQYLTFENGFITIPLDQVDQISQSLSILSKYIKEFPQFLDQEIQSTIVGIIAKKVNTFSYIINAAAIKCFKHLIYQNHILQLPSDQLLNIFNNIELIDPQVGQSIVQLLKLFILKFNDPRLFEPCFDVIKRILQSNRIIQEDYKKEACHGDDEGFEYNNKVAESLLVEIEIADLFAFLMNEYPPIMNENFQALLNSLYFSDQLTLNFKLPTAIILANIEAHTTKQFSHALESCKSVMTLYESNVRIHAIKLIAFIACHAEDEPTLIACYNILMAIIKGESCEVDEIHDGNCENEYGIDYDYSEIDESLIGITKLMIKYPQFKNEQTISLWFSQLPIYDHDEAKLAHNLMAQLLKTHTSFFIAPNNIKQTLFIIAKTCSGHFIDGETRNMFKQFIRSLISQTNMEQHITEAFSDLDECYQKRLQNFIVDSSTPQPEI